MMNITMQYFRHAMWRGTSTSPFKGIPTPPVTYTLHNLKPVMGVLSTVLLAALTWRWFRSPWIHSITDGLASLASVSFYLIFLYLQQPLLCLSIAVISTVWVYLPTAYSSLDLPSYATFMCQLKLVHPSSKPQKGDQQQEEAEEECKVCWDPDQRLAILPCSHYCCVRCLQLIGRSSQTACPICRKRLFSAHDRLVLVLLKGSTACAAANAIVDLLIAIVEFRRGEWLQTAYSVFFVTIYAVQLYLTGGFVRDFGEDWWRANRNPTPGGHIPWTASYSFGGAAILLCRTLISAQELFH